MSADAVPVTACRSCGSSELVAIVDLGQQPACDHFPPVEDSAPDPRWPLGLVMCSHCALLQLDHDSPAPEEPLAVESVTLQRHAVAVVDRVADRLGLPQGATYREFASHHGGSWAAALDGRGLRAVGSGAQLVVDNHSIIHAEDLDAQLTERVAALGSDGLLVIEFHHALRQLLDGQFDTIRHGHPLYFSLHSWAAACRRHGLAVIDAWPEDVFGGCLVVVARRGAHPMSAQAQDILHAETEADATGAAGYVDFARRIGESTAALRDFLTAQVAAGRRVAAYGAGSKACTFLGLAGIDATLVPFVADLAPGKRGRRIPGTAIPIVSPEELVAARPDTVAILTWDIADEVAAQLRRAGLDDARFVVPLPSLLSVD